MVPISDDYECLYINIQYWMYEVKLFVLTVNDYILLFNLLPTKRNFFFFFFLFYLLIVIYLFLFFYLSRVIKIYCVKPEPKQQLYFTYLSNEYVYRIVRIYHKTTTAHSTLSIVSLFDWTLWIPWSISLLFLLFMNNLISIVAKTMSHCPFHQLPWKYFTKIIINSFSILTKTVCVSAIVFVKARQKNILLFLRRLFSTSEIIHAL